jgi:hypothetical protein
VFFERDFETARISIEIAKAGAIYDGPSLPSWYSAEGLHKMLAAAPELATVGEVIDDLFGIYCDDARLARSLDEAAVITLRTGLTQAHENCTTGPWCRPAAIAAPDHRLDRPRLL